MVLRRLFEDQPLFAGFRELATGGKVDGKSFLVDKPVLNVFRMMGMLGGEYVAVTNSDALPLEQVLSGSVRSDADVNVVATRSEHKLEVMLWNYHDDDIAAEPTRVKLSISGLPTQRKFKAVEYLMDAEHSNAYAAWQDMGSPPEPTEKQFRKLQIAGNLYSQIVSAAAVENGGIDVPITLQRQGVMLIELTW